MHKQSETSSNFNPKKTKIYLLGRAPSLQILQPPRGGRRPLLQDVAARRQLGRASENDETLKERKKDAKVKEERRQWKSLPRKKATTEAEGKGKQGKQVATATSDKSAPEKVLDLPCWNITNYTPRIAGTHSMRAKTCCV